MRKKREEVATRVKDLILTKMECGETITASQLAARAELDRPQSLPAFSQYQVNNAISNALRSPVNIIRTVATLKKEGHQIAVTRKGNPALPKTGICNIKQVTEFVKNFNQIVAERDKYKEMLEKIFGILTEGNL